MDKQYEIYWDATRPVIHIKHGSGRWSDADFDAYEAALIIALAKAPAGGFDMLLDQSETTIQTDAITERRNDTLAHLLGAGLKRAIVVAPKPLVHLQTDRVHRHSGAAKDIFTICKTREEAEALLE